MPASGDIARTASSGGLPKRQFVTVAGQSLLQRAGASTDRPRVLFLSMYHLGWKTWTGYLERFTPACANLEAIHFHVVQPFWMKLLNRPLPKPIGRALVSPARAWQWYLRALFKKLLLAREFDAVFANSQILLPGLVDLCRVSGTKLMVCTDVTGPAYTRDLAGEDATRRGWEEEQRIYDACTLFAPMSDWIADSLVEDFRVSRDRIVVVPPVIDVAACAPHLPLEKRGGLPGLLFCGNDWQRKGGPRLVEWHQRHWSELGGLHIVSKDANLRPGLKNVVFHGAVPNDRLLREILPATDVFVLPTLRDMSPFAISEAQAFGIPTIASRIGGMANLVVDGVTGFLIPVADEAGFIAAGTRLLSDAGLRATMRAAAAEHARLHLDAGVIIPRLLESVAAAARKSP